MARGPSLDTVSAPTLREIRRRRKCGDTCADIGRALGMEPEKVRRICDHFGIARRRYIKPVTQTIAVARRAAEIREYWAARDPKAAGVAS